MSTPGQKINDAADALVVAAEALRLAGHAIDADLASLAHDIVNVQKAVDANTAKLKGPPLPDPGGEPDPGADNPPPTGGNPAAETRSGNNMGMVHKSWDPSSDLLDSNGKLVPWVVDVIEGVTGSIRFMDSHRINDDMDTREWNDDWKRILDWEIELCNQTEADFYLCFPFYASRTMVRATTAYVRVGLNKDLQDIYTWSNEVWNSGLGAHKEIARILPEVPDENNPGKMRKQRLGDSGFFDEWARWAQTCFDECKAVSPNCITVLETQTANKWITKQLLKPGRISRYDAVAITTYHGPGIGGKYASPGLTVDQIIESGQRKLAGKEIPCLAEHMEYLQTLDTTIIAYEGGNHYAVHPELHGTKTEKSMIKCQTDPRLMDQSEAMFQAYLDHGGIAKWHHYYKLVSVWDKWGGWGLATSWARLATSMKSQRLVAFFKRAMSA